MIAQQKKVRLFLLLLVAILLFTPFCVITKDFAAILFTILFVVLVIVGIVSAYKDYLVIEDIKVAVFEGKKFKKCLFYDEVQSIDCTSTSSSYKINFYRKNEENPYLSISCQEYKYVDILHIVNKIRKINPTVQVSSLAINTLGELV